MTTQLNSPRFETPKTDGLSKDILSNVKERSEAALTTVTDGVGQLVEWGKKNPVQAAALGAAVGFVFGAFIRKLASRR